MRERTSRDMPRFTGMTGSSAERCLVRRHVARLRRSGHGCVLRQGASHRPRAPRSLAGLASGSAMAVEIGSGLGRVCMALAERFDRVVGVDMSPEMVHRASEMVTDPRVSFRVGDGLGLPASPTNRSISSSPSPCSSTSQLSRSSWTTWRRRPVCCAPGASSPSSGTTSPARGAGRSAGRPCLPSSERVAPGTLRAPHARVPGHPDPAGPAPGTLTENGMELVGTDGLGTLYAMAWAVRRPGPNSVTGRRPG